MNPPNATVLAIIALINTLCAWGAVFVHILGVTKPAIDVRIVLTGIATAMFVFLAERGFRHLEFKAGAEGVLVGADADVVPVEVKP